MPYLVLEIRIYAHEHAHRFLNMLHTAGLVSFAAHITQHFPCHYQGVHAFIHQQHVCTLARLNRPHTQSLIAHQEAKESARNVTGAHPIVVVAAEAVAAAAAEAAAAAAALLLLLG